MTGRPSPRTEPQSPAVRPSSEESAADAPTTLRRFASTVRRTCHGVAFWLAATMPLVYVPLLAAGVDPPFGPAGFAVLLTLNVVAAHVGHGYRS